MRSLALRVALPDGERYTPLYERLPRFTELTGHRVEIVQQLQPDKLTAHLHEALPAGAEYHLVGSDSRYTAGLAPWLRPLEEILAPEELSEFEPWAIEQCRWGGRVHQLPRAQETRLLFYRSDFFDDRREREWFRDASGGRELQIPAAWEDVAAVAQYFTRPGTRYGFAFPGKGPGLVQAFAEIVTTVGGTCFDAEGRPRFYSRAGEWALTLLRDLLLRWEAVPPETPELDADAVAEWFRMGKSALVCDVPDTAHLLCDPCFSAVAAHHSVALYPAGPGGRRAVWSGCSTFAIPTTCPDPEGAAALLRFLTSHDNQGLDARNGAHPARTSALNEARENLREGTLTHRRFMLVEETLATAALTAPAVPQVAEMEACLWPLLQEAITGQKEVVPVLEQAQQALEALSVRC